MADRSLLFARRLLAAGLMVFLAGPALAQGRLDARYVLSVGGVELGRGSVTLRADDASYEISGSARLSGVLRAVSSAKGVAASRGALGGGRMFAKVFAMNAEADGKAENARIAMTGGAVRESDVEPPVRPAPDRVPVTDAVLRDVIDPMSGAFLYVPGTADLLSPAVCERAIPVYDGRQRYDVVLSFARKETVKVDGYSGPALVCAVRYRPVAGHRPSRYTVQYMTENKDMYAWLVPIPGTRLMAPFRVSVATRIGTALLEATSFSAGATEAGGR